MRVGTAAEGLTTLFVLCQSQAVSEFPRKAGAKLAAKWSGLALDAVLADLADRTDVAAFLAAFARVSTVKQGNLCARAWRACDRRWCAKWCRAETWTRAW